VKIVNIETLRVSLPFETGGERVGMRPGLSAWQSMESLMVRVETDDGAVGWGESFGHMCNPGTHALLDALVAPWFIGRDPRSITRLMDEALHAFHGFGRNGPALYAASGIDIALWDLAGQRAGQPLYRLLGGSDAKLERYASMMRYAGNAENIASACQRAQACGYRLIKLHETTVPAFRAARDAMPAEVDISLDVNCPWTVDEARAIATAIRDDGFHWLEEPVWPPEDFSGIARVRDVGVPIAAGENIGNLHEFKRALEAGALDVVQPSVIKVGGITGMRAVIQLAQAYSVRVMPHCFYWGPGYMATAHIAASMPKPTMVETAFIDFEQPPHPAFDPSTASLVLSDAPGLGFEPDMDVLEPRVISRNVINQ